MRFHLALMAVAVSSQVLAASSSGGSELNIAGISPGDTLRDITARLGQPATQEHSEGFVALHVKYDRLSFDLDDDRLVAGAETSNPKYCFNGWLCPGAALSEARSGLPGLTRPTTPGAPYIAFSDGDGCWLEITAPAQIIAALAVKCQP